MPISKWFVFFFSSLISASCIAEVLHNIEPLDTLGDIKKKYPNATLTRVKAAWVTEDQDFFSLEGPGFPGSLKIAFWDNRPEFRRDAEAARLNRPADKPDSESAMERVSNYLADRPDDDALHVNWVRWVPTAPIPMSRYRAKYGEPSKCEFSEDTMEPYCLWGARALTVRLTDDQKQVLMIEAGFTSAERRAAYVKRGVEIPDGLKEAPKSSPRATPPVASPPSTQKK